MEGHCSSSSLLSSKLIPKYDSRNLIGSPRAVMLKYVSLYVGAIFINRNCNLKKKNVMVTNKTKMINVCDFFCQPINIVFH